MLRSYTAGHSDRSRRKWGIFGRYTRSSFFAFAFKQAVEKRRCLIPANGFYEWAREGNRKVPMWIQLKTREPFAFPGLWDCWIDRETGTSLYSFTIITTHANALVSRIHNRMPVIYDRIMGRHWLNETVRDPLGLSLIMQPLPSEKLEPTKFPLLSIRQTTTRRNAFGGFRKRARKSVN